MRHWNEARCISTHYLDGVGAVRKPLVDAHLELAEEIKSISL